MQGPSLPEHGHEPVMMQEVLRGLGLDPAPSNPESIAKSHKLTIMDCTVGRGGHAARLAQAMAAHAGGTLVCLDVDPENLKYARHRIESALDNPSGDPSARTQHPVEIRTFHANFGEAPDVLAELGLAKSGEDQPPTGKNAGTRDGARRGLDALLADFGVSTNQLLDGKHGLSFAADLPLDMRLDPRIKKKAADLLADLDEKEIARILQDYAQERFAWRIARKIAQTRTLQPIQTTGQLARLVRSVVPAKWGQIDPATRTFQALRMVVNSELDSLMDLLEAVPGMMNPGGKAVFLSFHSGEDRLVKQAIRGWEETGVAHSLTKKPQEPTETEIARNPRARSAKLRSVEFVR